MLLLNFETDSVDQHGYLDGVELVHHWVHFRVFVMQNVLVDINELVQLPDVKLIEVLMDKEQLDFMEFN